MEDIHVYMHKTKAQSTLVTEASENRHVISPSMPKTGTSTAATITTTAAQVKRPIRVLKLQTQQSLPQQPMATPTLQPLHVSASLPTSGPYLAPLAANASRESQIVYEVSFFSSTRDELRLICL